MTTTALKHVESIDRTAQAHWVGDGFPVKSLFSYHEDAAANDPFLLLDYAEPYEFQPANTPRGVGAHPHRGFETVTVVLQGEVEHRDSAGNHGVVGPGDVQWMTAASGVIHEEFHSHEFTRRGGTFEVLQLWVNLPAVNKREQPAYQDLRAAAIPTVSLENGGTARVIAGELFGATGPARTHTPMTIADLNLAAGTTTSLNLPEGQTTLLVVRSGQLMVNGGQSARGVSLVRLSRDGDAVELAAAEQSAVLLLTGAPIGEPIVGSGPFVMNTESEIRESYREFQSGRMGRLPA
ncbi:MAG: pirin family protein [Planctomycetaceae bacterium]|nr:pirin family protein [Planctomycetaceae bacterium]